MQLERHTHEAFDGAADQGVALPYKFTPQISQPQDWPSAPRGLVSSAEGYAMPPGFPPPPHFPQPVTDTNFRPYPQGTYLPFMQMAPEQPHHPLSFHSPPNMGFPPQFMPPPFHFHPDRRFTHMPIHHGMYGPPNYLRGMPGPPASFQMHQPHPINTNPGGPSYVGPYFPQPGPSIAPQYVAPHMDNTPPLPSSPTTLSNASLTATQSTASIDRKARSDANRSRRSKFAKISQSHIGPASFLLYQFRSTVDRKWRLEELEGHVAEFCRDQYGSRFVQDAIVKAGEPHLDMVFKETMSGDILEISKDVFGNYVIQRLLERGSEVRRSEIFRLLLGNMRELSFHVYGCRVVQKLLDVISPEEQLEVIHELEPHIAACVQDAHGNHVVQKILEAVPASGLQFINAFEGRAVEFAKHSYGCRVLQRCLEHLPFAQAEPLLKELMAHTFEMITDQFGNYVIQYILENGPEREKCSILSLIKGRLLSLSLHKHASNVCEKAIMFSSPFVRQELVDELLMLVDGFPSGIWQMIHDKYGNYVLQRALVQSNSYQQSVLISTVQRLIQRAWLNRPSDPECKHITAIERILARYIPYRSARRGIRS